MGSGLRAETKSGETVKRKRKRKSCCRRFRQERTRPLSEADVLSIEEAACALSKGRDSVYAWLHKHQVVRTLFGSKRVIWKDVLMLLRDGVEEPTIVSSSDVEIPLSNEF
jgi:hypothetical protein